MTFEEFMRLDRDDVNGELTQDDLRVLLEKILDEARSLRGEWA